MRYQAFICIMTTLLAGCAVAASSGSAPLSEKLKGTPPAEQREILRLACLNGAEKITGRTSMWKKANHSSIPVHDENVEQMKSLCRKMDDAYLSQEPDANTERKHLKNACNAQLQLLDPAKNAQAIENMRKICSVMTDY